MVNKPNRIFKYNDNYILCFRETMYLFAYYGSYNKPWIHKYKGKKSLSLTDAYFIDAGWEKMKPENYKDFFKNFWICTKYMLQGY